jgi:lambda family phage portal protein
MFPGWGARRIQMRAASRYYDALDIGRLRTLSGTRRLGPVAESEGRRGPLLDQVRDLDRNNAFAHGVFDTLANLVVGRGIRLQAKIQDDAGQILQEENEAVERIFALWARGVDVTRRQSLAEFTWLLERELWIAGEAIVVRSAAAFTEDMETPLILELVESERLADLTETRGASKIVQGVEYDSVGRILAYHVHRQNPSDQNLLKNPSRVEAERVLHLVYRRRAGQVRGLPGAACCLTAFQALAQLLDFELTKARVASAFAVMLKRGTRGFGTFAFPSTGDASEAKDSAQNAVADLTGGMIFTGGKDDSIEGVASNVNSAALRDFASLFLGMIAAGIGCSYETLTRDYSRHNFSSIRQALIDERRQWEARQQRLVDGFLSHVWTWFVQGMARSEVFAPLSPEQLEQVRWVAQGWDWIDPAKDVASDAQAVRSYFANIHTIAARHGADVEENLRSLAEVRAQAESLGLPPSPELFDTATSAPEVPPNNEQAPTPPRIQEAVNNGRSTAVR